MARRDREIPRRKTWLWPVAVLVASMGAGLAIAGGPGNLFKDKGEPNQVRVGGISPTVAAVVITPTTTATASTTAATVAVAPTTITAPPTTVPETTAPPVTTAAPTTARPTTTTRRVNTTARPATTTTEPTTVSIDVPVTVLPTRSIPVDVEPRP